MNINETSLSTVQAMILALVAAGTALWGWLGWLLVVWICCMVLDYISGSAAAMKSGDWSSKAAREGLWHKCGMIIAVLVATFGDVLLGIAVHQLHVPLPVDHTSLLAPVVVTWYTLTELGSIAENAVLMGAAVPAWLRKILKVSADAVEQAGAGIVGQNGGKESMAASEGEPQRKEDQNGDREEDGHG